MALGAVGGVAEIRDRLTGYGTLLSTIYSQTDTYAITSDLQEIRSLGDGHNGDLPSDEELKYNLLAIRVVLKCVLDVGKVLSHHRNSRG